MLELKMHIIYQRAQQVVFYANYKLFMSSVIIYLAPVVWYTGNHSHEAAEKLIKHFNTDKHAALDCVTLTT